MPPDQIEEPPKDQIATQFSTDPDIIKLLGMDIAHKK